MTRKFTSADGQAASDHSRINVPLNIHNWVSVDEQFHGDLLWFHQHILDQGMGQKAVSEAVDYQWNTVFKFLKGTSTGSYEKFTEAIRGYRKIVKRRMAIQQQEFVKNSIASIIFSTLDNTFDGLCMALIIGESGMGKSTIMKAWRDANNHGRSVYVDCPPVGGVKAFLSAIGKRVGVGDAPIHSMCAAICRSFNINRILLLDNMHRALPSDPRSAAKIFDLVQHIQEESGCAIAMSATARLDSHMRNSTHMFEQTTGRCGTPVYLDSTVYWKDIAPIIKQYIQKPTAETKDHSLHIANGEGHIRQLVERLKHASRIASKLNSPMITDAHFKKALQVRAALSKHNKDGRKTA